MSRALTYTQTARASGALVLANARYWTSVAPSVRSQLSHWERRARAIPDPYRRKLASAKLRDERFNVELAATLATLAPRRGRADAIQAIVALQVMYDYLDLLSERAPLGPAGDDMRQYEALIDAVAPVERAADRDLGSRAELGVYEEDRYLRELMNTVRLALKRLPATAAVAEIAEQSAERCAQAQLLVHAAAHSGLDEPKRWARLQTQGGALQWPEMLAGSTASVLCLHALIAAAANPGTERGDAAELDRLYLSIGALTMLDSLVDREHDLATGELNYSSCYDSQEQMALSLATAARRAVARAGALRGGAHHLVSIVGIIAYYGSAPGAAHAFGAPVFARLRLELRPLMAPTLAVMRAWRLAKSVRRGRSAAGVSSLVSSSEQDRA